MSRPRNRGRLVAAKRGVAAARRERPRHHRPLRDAAIVELLRLELTPAEVADLRRGGVEESREPHRTGHLDLKIPHPNHERVYPLDWPASVALTAWLACLMELGEVIHEDSHVFVGRAGSPLRPRSVQDVVDRHARRAGPKNAFTALAAAVL